MNSKDFDNTDDAEFEALMQRTGDLAELLRAIPQPEPSAELDAAILAHAELVLSRGQTPAAANDAVLPESTKRPPSFIWRWRLPLGLAASVLLVLPIALTQWRATSKNEPSAMIAAAPPPASPAADAGAAAATATAPVAQSVPQLAEAKQAAKSADQTVLAQAETQAPSDALRRIKPSPLAAKKEAPTAEPKPIEDEKVAPTVLAQADTSGKGEARSRASNTAAPAPQPFPGTVPEEAKPAAKTEQQRQSRDHDTQIAALDARVGTGGRKDAGNEAPAPAARGNVKSKTLRSEIEANEPRQAAEARPADTMAGAASSMSAPAAAPPVADTRGFAQGSIVAPAKPAAPSAFPGSSTDNLVQEKAKAWLARIEKLIKADKRKETLEEWTKFRKAYPDYPVPKPLLDQITELQK